MQPEFMGCISGITSTQNDTAFFSEHSSAEADLGRLENGLEWRRARVYAEGVFARFFEYKFMYDFAANNPPRLKDAYLSYRLPFASMRLHATKVLSYGYMTPGVIILIEGLIGHGWASLSVGIGALVTITGLIFMALAPDG